MFSKNNLKYILILALGFFACSSIYLTESTVLAGYTSGDFANKVSVVYANLVMALGIFLFSLVYKKFKNIKQYYILMMLLSLISLITFFATENVMVMSISLCLCCLFGTSGFCGGYHFALMALNVEEGYKARVFGLGYALGSILAYVMTLLPSFVFASYISLFIYIPVILVNLFLVIRQKELDVIEKESYTLSFKKYFVVLSVMIIFMAFLSAISTDIISTYAFDIKGVFSNSRIWYGLGLVIAGIIYDKNKEALDIFTLTSFIFYLISIVLLNQKISPSIIVALSFFFLGFFVIFRTLAFMNLSLKKKNMLFMAAYGLMFSRIVEGSLAVFENDLLEHYLVVILLEAIVLGLLLWMYILLYMKNNSMTENDKAKELSLKYNLSVQEEKVLNLLIQDLTNQEMADKLFLSVNTIRNHVANIYKKTGMKKKELREKCYFRTN